MGKVLLMRAAYRHRTTTSRRQQQQQPAPALPQASTAAPTRPAASTPHAPASSAKVPCRRERKRATTMCTSQARRHAKSLGVLIEVGCQCHDRVMARARSEGVIIIQYVCRVPIPCHSCAAYAFGCDAGFPAPKPQVLVGSFTAGAAGAAAASSA